MPHPNLSISTRSYLYPLPHPLPPGTPVPYTLSLPEHNPLSLPPRPTEPTSTLVLTSAKRWFVDVRVLKPEKKDGDEEEDGDEGPWWGDGKVLKRERLDWAFAGLSTSTPIPDPYPSGHTLSSPSSPTKSTQTRSFSSITHATWTHTVDSRHPLPSSITPPADTGTMFTLSDTHTLEWGSARDARTGKMEAYEEMWVELEVAGVPASLASASGEGKEGKNLIWSVVLRVEDEAHGVSGVVCRVGRWCQGVLVMGSRVCVERWEFVDSASSYSSSLPSMVTSTEEGVDDEARTVVSAGNVNDGDEGGEGSWKRRLRVGDLWLPCAVACQAEELVEGGEVRYGEFRWRVEEVGAWREDE